MRSSFGIAALMALASAGFGSNMGSPARPIGPGKGKFWDKSNKKPKMNLSVFELEFLANSGGKTKKEYVKKLKAKYL